MSCKPVDGLVNDGVLGHLLLKVAHLAGSILEGQDGDAHGLFVGHDVETLDDEIGMGRYKELDASIGKAQYGVEKRLMSEGWRFASTSSMRMIDWLSR